MLEWLENLPTGCVPRQGLHDRPLAKAVSAVLVRRDKPQGAIRWVCCLGTRHGPRRCQMSQTWAPC